MRPERAYEHRRDHDQGGRGHGAFPRKGHAQGGGAVDHGRLCAGGEITPGPEVEGVGRSAERADAVRGHPVFPF